MTAFPGIVSIRANDSDNRIGLFTSPRAVMRHVRRGAFDVVHVHEPLTPPVPFYAVWASAAAARVCTFHRYSEREGEPTRLARRVLAPHLNAYDVGVAVSEPAAHYARVAWARPMAIVPNGVDTDFFRASTSVRNGSPLKLLFVGQWMDRRKGLSVLLEALQRLRADGVRATLDIVGHSTGSHARPDGLGDVTVHGVVDEDRLRDLMQASDLFVAPSLGCESFGMVLIEAMAAGRPVVCSDIEGYRQVASPGGTVLVRPGDPAALAHALRTLAQTPDRRLAMGQQNVAHAHQYDWAIVAGQVRDLYGEAMELAGARSTRRRSPAFRAASLSFDRRTRSDDAGADAIREV